MRVFVTGASGWVGSAVVPELLAAGHEVAGLARSDESAAAVANAGAEVVRGSLADIDILRAAATEADGVIHTAYIHDFSRMNDAAAADLAAIEAIGAALEGSDKPLVISSGTALLGPGRVVTEEDRADPNASMHRARNEIAALALAERGVRASAIRLSPSVHGDGDKGFIPFVIGIARQRGVSGYIGDGSNRWPAVHRLDAARLYRLALENAPAGSRLHGVGDEGVATRDIAEIIGRHLDLPVASVSPDDAPGHFDWMAGFWGLDAPASSALTQKQLGWKPEHPGLIEDLDAGHYFDEVATPAVP